MPFKSHAHREHCRKLVSEGKVSQEQFDKWSEGTAPDNELPDRVRPKRAPARPLRKRRR